jgi:hypothetical protein
MLKSCGERGVGVASLAITVDEGKAGKGSSGLAGR